MKMFCIPYAGGSANVYWDWKDVLGSWCEIVPVEYNGHGGLFCEEFYRDVDEASEDICNRYIMKNDEPYIIYGHSLGSIMAFETYFKLVNKNIRKPECIILSGTRPPHLLYKDEKISLLPKEVFMDKIFELGNTPAEILENEELKSLFYEILLSDMKLIDSYKHNEELGKIEVPLFVFTGAGDEDAPMEDMQEWGNYCDLDFSLKVFEGNHFFPFIDKTCTPFFDEIKKVLEKFS